MQLPAMRLRVLGALFLIVLTIAVLLAAHSSPKRRFERALALEHAGQYNAALVGFQALLPRIPPSEEDAISKTEAHIGECLWQLGDPNEALRMFEKAIAVSSGNLAAHLRLADIYLAGGAPNIAAQHAQYVVAQQPTNADALSVLGASYVALGQMQLATAFFEQAVAAEPGRPLVAIQLADVYDRVGKPGLARQVLQKALLNNPQDPRVRITLGRLEEQEGNLPAAEEAYRSAVVVKDSPESNFALAQFLQRASRIPEAELVLRRLDKRDPDQPSRLADFEMIAGRPANAMERYTRELTNPENQPDRNTAAAIASRLIEADLTGTEKGIMSPAQRARIHLEQCRARLDSATLGILEAEIALAEGNPGRAQEQAAAALAKSPDSVAAHYVLGIAKYRGGDKPGARNEWEAALEADGAFVPARIAAGRLAFETGDTEEAESDFAAALRQEPANLEALVLYARVLTARNRILPALQIARRAIAVDASSPVPNLVIGDILLQQQRPGQALVYFEKAVVLDPDNHEGMEGLIRVYRSGTVTRAMLQHIEKIAAHEPRSATLYELVGRLYADHGWYPDAVRAYRAALGIQPSRATAAADLAKVLARTGAHDDAARVAQHMGGASADLLRAVDAEKRNDVPAAIDHYESAIRAGDRTGVAANNLAWLYAERGSSLDRALTLAQQARDLSPSNAAFLDTLGYVHLRRREYSEALDTLKKAVELSSAEGSRRGDSARFREHLALAYRLSGQPDQAEKVTAE